MSSVVIFFSLKIQNSLLNQTNECFVHARFQLTEKFGFMIYYYHHLLTHVQ